MHAITTTGWREQITKFKLVQRMEKAKEQGKIKHMAFSFHANMPIFKEVLHSTPNWAFFQNQLNYIDTEYNAGILGMKYAHDRGMGVIAMEPLRGGFMANMPAGAKAIFAQAQNTRSEVEWAFDYLWNMPEISLVLSGMSAMQHVVDNLEYAGRSSVGMLSNDDRIILTQVVQHLQLDYDIVPCTGCELCRLVCPENVAIAQIMIAWNQYKWGGPLDAALKRIMGISSTYGFTIDACTECGKCIPACPYGVNMPEVFKEIRKSIPA